ncbi:hypothetical protein [Streptomyces sp. SID13031]|uniref:hypothetical protein n=1 Tax=Streptomyces sp. SID13031 TaxID=2706046 RepID=UPI0013CA460E|nr:hypothetical protein [Streptomyces sp. SID13031]NEA31260.1 hypothetical protein [Streptomyces sp. SID13031]
MTAERGPAHWDVLWSMLCGGGIVYSASFAVLPWLLDQTRSEDPDGVLQAVTLAGAIIARADQPHGAGDVRTHYAAEIEQLLARKRDLVQTLVEQDRHDRLIRMKLGRNWADPAGPTYPVERDDLRPNALRAVVSDHMAPLLKEAGFARSGPRFTLTTASGDQAWILAHRFELGEYDAEFHVDSGVRPSSLDAVKEAKVPIGDSVLDQRMSDPWDSLQMWKFDLDDTATIAIFKDALRDLRDHLAHLVADRQNLLALLRDPAARVRSISGPRDRLLAVSSYDLGPSEELETALRSIEQRNPSDRLPAWIRQQLAANS